MDEHLSARNMDIPPPISPEAGKEAVEGVGEVGAAGWRAVKDTSSRIVGNVNEAVDCAKDAFGSAKDAAVDTAKETDAGLVGWISENWAGIYKGLVTTFIIAGAVIYIWDVVEKSRHDQEDTDSEEEDTEIEEYDEEEDSNSQYEETEESREE